MSKGRDFLKLTKIKQIAIGLAKLYLKCGHGFSLSSYSLHVQKKKKKKKSQDRERQIFVFPFPNLSQADDRVNGLEKKLSCQGKLNFHHN